MSGFVPDLFLLIKLNLTISTNEKSTHKGCLFVGGISRTRTYDPHDVNVVL